jgi:hypothetical protein
MTVRRELCHGSVLLMLPQVSKIKAGMKARLHIVEIGYLIAKAIKNDATMVCTS